MVWIFALGVTVGAGWILYKAPMARVWTLRSIAAAGAIGVLVWQYYEQKERSAQSAIKPSQIVIGGAVLLPDESGHFYHFTGTATNTSKFTLSSLEFKFTLEQCGEKGNCITIGESNNTEFVTIPPGQMRGIDVSVWFSDLPPSEKPSWNFEVAGARANM